MRRGPRRTLAAGAAVLGLIALAAAPSAVAAAATATTHPTLTVVKPAAPDFALPADPICQKTKATPTSETTVTVRGAHFAAHAKVTLSVPGVAAKVATATASPGGRFRVTFTDPAHPADHTTKVKAAAGSHSATATYDSGFEACFEAPKAHTATVDGEGWNAGGTVSFAVGSAAGKSITASPDGAFAVRFTPSCPKTTSVRVVIKGLVGTTKETLTSTVAAKDVGC